MVKKRTKAPLGATMIVISSFFYASYGIWTKLMGDFFGGYTASAIRSVLVLLCLVPFAFVFKKMGPLNLRKNWKYIAGMLFAALFTWGPLYYAILHVGIGIGLAIQFASIVLGTFVFSRLMTGERFTKDKAVSATLGIVGICLVFAPTTSHLGYLALIGALVSGLSAAMTIVLAKQIHYNGTQSAVVLWVTSLIANFFMVFLINETIPAFHFEIVWFYLVIFAVASSIASLLFINGSKMIDAGAASLLCLLEIVFGVFFGMAFFGERPGTLALIGVAIIMLSSAIPYIRSYDTRRGKLR
jgi:drug/metabolite transporter (DMT)-like permease